MERKEKLIEELKTERYRFLQMFMDSKDHDLAINYLETGVAPRDININNYPLLFSAVCDFETLCNDYDV